jgi:hypothetical protein
MIESAVEIEMRIRLKSKAISGLREGWRVAGWRGKASWTGYRVIR